MENRSKTTRHAEGEGPMSVGDMLALLGQIYIAVLLTLIIGVANVDVGGLLNAAGVLQFGDPTEATSFTA